MNNNTYNIHLPTVPLILVCFTFNENKTKARSALLLAGSNESTNQNAERADISMSLNEKQTCTKAPIHYFNSFSQYKTSLSTKPTFP